MSRKQQQPVEAPVVEKSELDQRIEEAKSHESQCLVALHEAGEEVRRLQEEKGSE